ncbi:repressor [Achromatium sp. WMS2]|nr:repressor [Achromatium sp. WMS2]
METDCSLSEPYAMQVLGVDMEPEFPDRCIVIIAHANSCVDGNYVFAEVEGVRWFRQYKEDSSGRKWLAAVNPIFPDIELNSIDYRILGVIIQRNIRRKIKHYT